MVAGQTLGELERQRLLDEIVVEHRPDHEARQAIMGLIVRVVDEMRFGLREVNIDELQTLAFTWSQLNDGTSPAEAALRFLRDSD